MTCKWRWRIAGGVAALVTMLSSAAAQPGGTPIPLAPRFTDPAGGLSLEQAIAQALAREPSLRAVRAEVDVARGLHLQAGLRPNPSVSFEQREEPGGTDRQTTIGVEWPLDLFRRSGRVEVADREVVLAAWAVTDRERLLAADVRARYGDVLAAVRDLAILDSLVAATARQRDLLRSRVDEGASPPLERDLLQVEVRRLESDRLLQAGRAEAALFELKQVMGRPLDDPLTVAGTLEAIVQAEAARDLSADGGSAQARSDVQAAEARIGLAEARLDRARREGRFDVSVFGSYMRMDAGFPQRAFGPEGGPERIGGSFITSRREPW
jgi:cobalt-zinc-cadmium efflux system outer membrane protein